MRRQTTDTIVVHCSATKENQDIRAADIDEWHKARGWSGIGYHLVICRDSIVEAGRPLDDQGAHVASHNKRTVGVCMVGGIDAQGRPEDNFTQDQYDALGTTIDFLLTMYPDCKVLGHRDLSPDLDGDGIIEEHEWLKACPCFDVRAWWGNRFAPTPERTDNTYDLPNGARLLLPDGYKVSR